MDTGFPAEHSPAQRRREKVRDTILAAAERVFAAEGESGLSIRRLAEAIDYSPSAIYKYFGSKEELLDELKESFFQRLLTRVDNITGTSRPFEERARACVVTYVETATERPHHYAAAFSSVANPVQEISGKDDGAGEEFLKSNKGRAFSHLVGMVREGQNLGVFDRSLDPHAAALSVWASSHRLAQLMIHLPHLPPGPCGAIPPGRSFTDIHASHILRGLRPAQPSQQEDIQNGPDA